MNDVTMKRTTKKTMLRILPYILLMYVIAYLDRVNLGFAALEMNADLALSAEVFGVLSGIFFIGYFFFEVPSNMIMHKVGARIWIARIMLTWGIVVILTGFVQSATHLYILRFLLGVAEAGFFPGIVLYFTYWFRETDRGKATSSLMIALPLSGLLGAPLSTWIIDNISWASLEGWRWMFILEGIPAIIFGVVTLFYLTDRPVNAKWLSDNEKTWLEGELRKEREAAVKLNKPTKGEMLKDKTLWKLVVFYFANFTGMIGLSFWFPSIIKSLTDLNTTNMQIGWLSMLPPLVGIPAIMFMGWNTDRIGKHRLHLLICITAAIVGFIGFLSVSGMWPTILMLSIAAGGLYGFGGCFFAYLTFFFTEETSPVGIALVNSIAALGGFVGPFILGAFGFSSGMILLIILLVVSLAILSSLPKTNTEVTNKGHEQKSFVNAENVVEKVDTL
ncbi:MFS transporter [Rummeliibacillus sp. JY-2-4R]